MFRFRRLQSVFPIPHLRLLDIAKACTYDPLMRVRSGSSVSTSLLWTMGVIGCSHGPWIALPHMQAVEGPGVAEAERMPKGGLVDGICLVACRHT